LDQVQQFTGATSVINLGIKNSRDFKLGFVIYHNGGWGGLNLIGDWVWIGGFQNRDVEHWVYGSEAVGELYCDGMSTQLCQDLIGSKKFVREFLGRPGHTKELGLNIDSAAALEFQSRDSSGIGRCLVVVLSFSNVQPKLLVQLVEVGDENLGACQCKVTFRVNGDVQMITLVGKEGCNASGSTQGIAVCELGQW